MSQDRPLGQGVLEMNPKGFGFLRNPKKNYVPQGADPFVPGPLIQKWKLREGVSVSGPLEAARPGTQARLHLVEQIEGAPAAEYRPRDFDELTPIDPNVQIILETGPEPLSTRIMDLMTPIGRGQRGLIVAPPRTGKTILLQQIAQAVIKNYPDMKVVMLLVDERPEEVTEMRRTIQGEVIASSSDRESSAHTRIAQLVVERARRLAELGKDVFLLLDSLTRLARAFNKSAASGRTMSGGIDSQAMEVPRRMFGAARLAEEGGSITVMATCLVETGSRMDDHIFQEFKGTGNMELVLDRKLADRRIFPAIDINSSGTRKEERLLEPETFSQVTLLRRSLSSMGPKDSTESLVQQLGKSPTNKEFLLRIAKYIR
jgi:transcription termination factor Rho